MGLGQKPKWEVSFPSIGRVDLVSGNTLIEVKKAVNCNVGPGQLEAYLKHFVSKNRLRKDAVRGILVQKNDWPAPGVQERLAEIPYPVELWSVDQNEGGRWKAERLL